MRIELQCSNCGERLSLEPTEFWKYGWRFTGVPYCHHCIKTWKERNGQEWNEQYDEAYLKDKFYEYLFDKIERERGESEEYVVYENKDSITKELGKIINSIDYARNKLESDYNDLYDCYISDLEKAREDNNSLIDNIVEELVSAIDDLEDLKDDIFIKEIY